MKRISIIICLALVVSGCDDMLDIAPQSQIEVSNFFASAADFELALVGAYDPIAYHQGGTNLSNGFGTYFRGLLMMGRAGTDRLDRR